MITKPGNSNIEVFTVYNDSRLHHSRCKIYKKNNMNYEVNYLFGLVLKNRSVWIWHENVCILNKKTFSLLFIKKKKNIPLVATPKTFTLKATYKSRACSAKKDQTVIFFDKISKQIIFTESREYIKLKSRKAIGSTYAAFFRF